MELLMNKIHSIVIRNGLVVLTLATGSLRASLRPSQNREAGRLRVLQRRSESLSTAIQGSAVQSELGSSELIDVEVGYWMG